RDLLFGILAVQMGLLSLEALAEGVKARSRDESRTLRQILAGRGALSGRQQSLLETMVGEHLAERGEDAPKSFAAVVTTGARPEGRDRLHDDDQRAGPGVRIIEPGVGVPRASRAGSVGMPSSSGNRFRIICPHARGGLGEVYVARDEELHREVALKELQDRFAHNPRSRQRFLQEAEITGGLEHPGI